MDRLDLYARVSTAGQSLASQFGALRRYAAYTNAEALEFVDHGVSGRRDRRPCLDELMNAVRRGEISGVVITCLDRMARSVKHLVNLSEELSALGVNWS